jgi:hypothetical protein
LHRLKNFALKKRKPEPSRRKKIRQVEIVIFFTSEISRLILSPNFNTALEKLCYQVGLVTAASFDKLEKRSTRNK